MKRVSKNAFFHARMVTDGTFKLEYASVIFVDPSVQIDKT